ncbi:MAG: Ig-like domain-containing protein, partial [Acidobacteriota bacterium]|nr:Ig-like domain-containing protein [Acidobacteriota bacterium]
MIKTAAWGAAVLLLGAGEAAAQQQINLTASGTGLVLGDGTWTPMWGYFCGTAVSGSTATCAAANPNAPPNFWSPVIITVPTGQDLQINLTNNLSFTPSGSTTPNNIPTSLMIVGQVGGGLGSVSSSCNEPSGTLVKPTGSTCTPSPEHANQPVTWSTINAAGGVFTPPAQGPRVQSFGTEVAAGSRATALTWKAPRPGTYLLESGTHPSVQGTMGLIGMVVVTAAPAKGAPGTAYPTGYLNKNATAVTYNGEVPLIFSEIDPNQNKAVTAAVNSVGFNESATYGILTGVPVATVSILNGGSGYTGTPTVQFSGGGVPSDSSNQATGTAVVTNGVVTGITLTSNGSGYTSNPIITISGGAGTGALAEAAVSLQADALAQCQGQNGPLPAPSACYPPTVNYTPLYYLINGVAFSKTSRATSVFPATQGKATGAITGNVLVHFVNAGSHMHVPSIVGSQAPNGAAGFQLIAEDGNVIPGVGTAAGARVQSEVFMAAGKTYDVMINAPASGSSAIPVFDRELSLSGGSVNRDSGMIAYIGVNGSTVAAPAVKAVANPDIYNAVIPGQTFTVSDSSKGVIANDLNIYAVQVILRPTQGYLTLNSDGAFTYAANSTWHGPDTFVYCGNGATFGPACAKVTLNLESLESAGAISVPDSTWTSKLSTYIKVPPPGVLTGAIDPAGYPLSVTQASITAAAASGVVLDADGGFTATGSYPTALVFNFRMQNSQGVVSTATPKASVEFAQPSNLAVTVKDPKSGATISDYRWIIEEDKSFYIDPGCTSNPPHATSAVTGLPCIKTSSGKVPILGVNFHTSDMTYVAQGCTGTVSCESGQTVLGIPAVCDVGNGACRTTATQKTAVLPSQVSLDPTKRYYISVLPGDAADPLIAGNTAPDCSANAPTASSCGHGMGGAPISFPATGGKPGTTPNPV